MYFNFACSHCGKKLRVQEELAGRNVRCPYCKGAVTVPEPQAEQPPAATSPAPQPTRFDPVAAAGPTAASPPGAASSLKVDSSVARKRGGAGPARGGANDDGTNVSLLFTALLGAGMTILFYGLLFPLPKMYFRDLFYDRGWVTFAEAFLMYWAIAILFVKSRKLMRQRESMLLDFLPESFGRDIRLENVGPMTDYVRGLPVDTRASFLARRVLRGLEHYSVRGAASEVSTMLSSQAELDNNAVASSYSLLNVFIWAIPILGFIGTVQGLGDAVGNLSGSLEAASDVESIKKSLGGITSGLGVAFDTTLVALIMSLGLKFPASSLQKAEEDLLNWVEDYCNENLLKRLVDVGGETPESTSDRDVRAAVQSAVLAAVAPLQAELRTWAEHWSTIHQRQLEATSRTQESWVGQSQAVRDQLEKSLAQSAGSFTSQLALMREAVEQLNTTLGQLDGKQVQIERRKRGWFW
ncbi:MAG: MotA/TolQ/ExbB proton channel family protein [Pirellulales bacterium]